MDTKFSSIVKSTIGAIAAAFAGLHVMIQVLFFAISADILTGLICAWMEGKISSDVSRRGIARKVLMLVATACAEFIGRKAALTIAMPWGTDWTLGAAVAAYYAVQEGVSIAENMARAGVPLPKFVSDRLAKLREIGG